MKLYYEVVGEGYPIICLHGNGEDHHIFDDLTKKLIKKYQVILVDSRCHGNSENSKSISYKEMMDDVIELADDLRLEAYDVIGFSDGGILSLMLALNDQRVKHIISLGANSQPQMIKSIYRFTIIVQTICLIPFCLFNKEPRLSFKLNMLMLKEPDLTYEQLSHIKIPALILAGEYDMIKEEDTINISKAIKYSILKIIRNGNHFLLRDSFKETSNEITLFLEACHKER